MQCDRQDKKSKTWKAFFTFLIMFRNITLERYHNQLDFKTKNTNISTNYPYTTPLVHSQNARKKHYNHT